VCRGRVGREHLVQLNAEHFWEIVGNKGEEVLGYASSPGKTEEYGTLL
jgi:hypothetical protein